MKFRNIPIDANCTYDFVLLNSCTYSNPNGDPDLIISPDGIQKQDVERLQMTA